MHSSQAPRPRRPFHSVRRLEGGFSLIELMVVVVIIAILATLGTYGYGKWIARARRTEAVGMLAEMSAKEMVYFSEFGAYLPLRLPNGDTTIDEANAAFYPIAPNDAAFFSRNVATSIANGALWPVAWRSIGMRPRRTELFCTYLLNSGPANTVLPVGATFGVRLLGAAAIPLPWFYAIAACNFDGAAGLPNDNHVMAVTHNSPVLREWNEGK
ncbi:MAG: prepilin-type N-terminal cleavage/methylation domain-containing protein [Deltaproteobacteria bacterium]|nr:prepilin-type N-terminal cleavage/methylation domain-containing protein [Deltaproteobacteria bacterium]